MVHKRSFGNDFRSAVQFITVLPAGRNVLFSPLGMIRCFPLVGLLTGLLLWGVDSLMSQCFPTLVVVTIDTVFLVVITGGFHLDGLGDTADGIFSHRSRERALEIMKDSRTGMMGLVAVVSILALKAVGLYAMKNSLAGYPLAMGFITVPALARSGMLFGIRYLNYGRNSSGTGYDLFARQLPIRDFLWMLVPMGLAVFMGAQGLLVLGGFGLTVFCILRFYKIKMGCITGDMLGAMVEVTEAVLFLSAGAGLM